MASASASFVALALASWLFAPPSEAGENQADGAAANDTAATSDAVAPDEERGAAKQAFDEGIAAVAAGKYENAVDSFHSAYELRPHPVTLFNLAVALEKAGRLPEAWELYDTMLASSRSSSERSELRRHMRVIEPNIAIVEVEASPRRRLCIDGLDMPQVDKHGYRLAVAPGSHELMLDDRDVELDLGPGDHPVLLLEGAEDLLDSQRRGRVVPAMLGLSIIGGGAAVGLGVGSTLVDDPTLRTGLAIGAAAGAGVALVTGVVALLVETRVVRDRSAQRHPERSRHCPGSDANDHRLDLELRPSLGQPIEFAAMPMPTMSSIPTPTLSTTAEHPRLRGIRPPRGT